MALTYDRRERKKNRALSIIRKSSRQTMVEKSPLNGLSKAGDL